MEHQDFETITPEMISSQLDPYWIELAYHQGIEHVLPPLKWREAVKAKKFEGNEDGSIDVSEFKFDIKKMVQSSCGYSPIHPRLSPLLEEAGWDNIIEEITVGDEYFVAPNGDGIRIELDDEISGCQPHPEVTQCFAFSFYPSNFFIEINLVERGIDAWVLDYVRPIIRITQKVNHRRDCSAKLEFGALLNSKKNQWTDEDDLDERFDEKPLDERLCKSEEREWEQWTNAEWEDMTIEFDDYPSGMRHLTILNRGQDQMFWAGFYGPKIANIKVEVILPDIPILKPFEQEVDELSPLK